MRQLKARLLQVSTKIAPLALAMAILTANSTCFFYSYQPSVPGKLKKMKKL